MSAASSRAAWSLLLACLLSSGCASGPTQEVGQPPSVTTITEADDYTYLDDELAGCGFHIHDYWGGATKLTVAERSFRFEKTSPGPQGRPLDLPAGNTVIPGTAWLNATARWTSPDGLQKAFALEVRTASAETFRIPLKNGEVTSRAVNETMTDPPHTTVSHWSFTIWMDGMGIAEIQLSLELARRPGPLPFAPPHPDHWQGRDEATLYESQGPLFEFMSLGSYIRPNARANESIRQAEMKPVAVHSKQLIVEFWYNSTSPTMLHYDPRLMYQSADQDRGTYYSAPRNVSQRQNRDGYFAWHIQPQPPQWDSPYAKHSHWSLGFWWSASSPTLTYMDGDFHIRIHILRDPDAPQPQAEKCATPSGALLPRVPLR